MQVSLQNVCVAIVTLSSFILVYLYYNLSRNNESSMRKFEKAYGVICDAGSTGTRMFVYSYSSSNDKELIKIEVVVDEQSKPVIRKVTPGLSSFGTKPNEATAYIAPLLKIAEKHIPPDQLPFTPLFIFATAGMRLLPEEQQQAILKNLRTGLPNVINMHIKDENIDVIEGKWEGIYSWIAVNYALGKFERTSTDVQGTASQSNQESKVGMIDMGGASVQIAIELPKGDPFSSEHVEMINLGSHDDDTSFQYKLFVSTFLGYGANEGLRRYEKILVHDAENENSTDVIDDDCLPLNLYSNIGSTDDAGSFGKKGTGNWTGCLSRLSTMIENQKTDECQHNTCFFSNILAPSVSLSIMDLYGFSEYWYTTQDVLDLGGVYNWKVFSDKSKQYCEQSWNSIMAKKQQYKGADEDRLKSQCFKSAWISTVLHNAFNVDKEKNKFRSALTIAGQEVQWALGAMIYHMRYFPLKTGYNGNNSRMPPSNTFRLNYQLVGLLLLIVAVLSLSIARQNGLVSYCVQSFSKRQKAGRNSNSGSVFAMTSVRVE